MISWIRNLIQWFWILITRAIYIKSFQIVIVLKLYLLLVLLPDLAAWFLLENVMQAVTLWQNSVWVQIGTQRQSSAGKKASKGYQIEFWYNTTSQSRTRWLCSKRRFWTNTVNITLYVDHTKHIPKSCLLMQ